MDSDAWSSPKADRIRRAARALLLRRGARSVTISEVARLAQVGKGTVYLYWDTKEDLIIELFAREFLAVLDQTIATLADAPDKVVPHELFPLIQRVVRTHPLLMAIQTRDHELLGLVDGHPAIQTLVDTAGPAAVLAEILPVLREHGLVRTDLSLEAQIYATTAILQGFFHLPDIFTSAKLRNAINDPEAVLGEVSRLMLETTDPVGPETVAAASAVVLARMRRLRRSAAIRPSPAAPRGADASEPMETDAANRFTRQPGDWK